MSLSGPLYHRKDYMRYVLRPHNIRLRDVRTKYTADTISFYEFIWDTPNADPKIELIHGLRRHIQGLEFHIVLSTLNTLPVASKTGPKSVTYSYRHTAQVEVVPASN